MEDLSIRLVFLMNVHGSECDFMRRNTLRPTKNYKAIRNVVRTKQDKEQTTLRNIT